MKKMPYYSYEKLFSFGKNWELNLLSGVGEMRRQI